LYANLSERLPTQREIEDIEFAEDVIAKYAVVDSAVPQQAQAPPVSGPGPAPPIGGPPAPPISGPGPAPPVGRPSGMLAAIQQGVALRTPGVDPRGRSPAEPSLLDQLKRGRTLKKESDRPRGPDPVQPVSFLDELNQGVKLRKVEAQPRGPRSTPAGPPSMMDELTSKLASRLGQKHSQEDPDDDVWDPDMETRDEKDEEDAVNLVGSEELSTKQEGDFVIEFKDFVDAQAQGHSSKNLLRLNAEQWGKVATALEFSKPEKKNRATIVNTMTEKYTKIAAGKNSDRHRFVVAIHKGLLTSNNLPNALHFIKTGKLPLAKKKVVLNIPRKR
jgi:hypothetical protein